MREKMAADSGMELLVHQNPECVRLGINPFDHGSAVHTDMWKTQGLKQALDQVRVRCRIRRCPARRGKVAGQRADLQSSGRPSTVGIPKQQRPELWRTYNVRRNQGESMRVFPLSNWTELDVWQYIYREQIPIVPLYLAAERPVVERDGVLIMVDDDRMPLDGQTPELRSVRFRTLGCYPLTGAIESTAATLPEVIQEMLLATTSEREGRVIDFDASGSMEKKKQEGYF